MNLNEIGRMMGWRVIPTKEADRVARDTAIRHVFLSNEDTECVRTAVDARFPRVMLSRNRSFTIDYYNGWDSDGRIVEKFYISPLTGYAPSGHFTVKEFLTKEEV